MKQAVCCKTTCIGLTNHKKSAYSKMKNKRAKNSDTPQIDHGSFSSIDEKVLLNQKNIEHKA
jgi:hypothetical protein